MLISNYYTFSVTHKLILLLYTVPTSQVGQAVIQIARSRGLKTINLIRPRCASLAL